MVWKLEEEGNFSGVDRSLWERWEGKVLCPRVGNGSVIMWLEANNAETRGVPVDCAREGSGGVCVLVRCDGIGVS